MNSTATYGVAGALALVMAAGIVAGCEKPKPKPTPSDPNVTSSASPPPPVTSTARPTR